MPMRMKIKMNSLREMRMTNKVQMMMMGMEMTILMMSHQTMLPVPN